MDYLISKDQAVLYDLFRLPTFPNSQCMLIGISNAIELTDRFLPKLQSLNCQPLVMTFCAYSKDQILKILQQRLMGLPCQVFQPEALEICARKVAATWGYAQIFSCLQRSCWDAWNKINQWYWNATNYWVFCSVFPVLDLLNSNAYHELMERNFWKKKEVFVNKVYIYKNLS